MITKYCQVKKTKPCMYRIIPIMGKISIYAFLKAWKNIYQNGDNGRFGIGGAVRVGAFLCFPNFLQQAYFNFIIRIKMLFFKSIYDDIFLGRKVASDSLAKSFFRLFSKIFSYNEKVALYTDNQIIQLSIQLSGSFIVYKIFILPIIQ